MSPVMWFAFVMFGISAVCFVADAFLKLGEDAGSSNGRDTEAGVETPSPLSFSEALRPVGPLASWEETRRR